MATPAAPSPASDEMSEISLVDVARVLYRRRAVLAITFVLALVAGGAITFFTTPQYEAKATVIPANTPVIVPTLIKSWLESRQAAEFAATEVGRGVNRNLYPDAWDDDAQAWRGTPPTEAEIGEALRSRVTVSGGTTTTSTRVEPTITISVRLPEAGAARDVAAAYVASLDDLRPQLENITRGDLFKQYYDGTNEQAAQRRAETSAREAFYWAVFDTPTIPSAPVSPRPVLNMVLAAAAGVVLALLTVFVWEWLSKYRTEFQRVEPLPPGEARRP